MAKSDKNAKKSAAERMYGGFAVSNIRRPIRSAVISPVDFRRSNFRRRIRRSAAAEGSTPGSEGLPQCASVHRVKRGHTTPQTNNKLNEKLNKKSSSMWKSEAAITQVM